MHAHPRSTPSGSLRNLAPLLFTASLLGLGACAAVQAKPVEELDLWDDSAAGVTDKDLAVLCRNAWESELRRRPFEATYLGDPRYNGDVPDLSRNKRAERRGQLLGYVRAANAIPEHRLTSEDLLTRELFVHELERSIALIDLGLEEWSVDPLEGPHMKILSIAQVQPVRSERDRARLVERWQSFPDYIRQTSTNLRNGKKAGKVASRTAVRKVIAQLEALLDVDPFDSPLVEIAMGDGTWVELPPDGSVAAVAHEELGDARRQRELRLVNLHAQDGERLLIGTRLLIPAPDDPLSPTERGKFLYAVLTSVEEELYPAFAGLRDFLAREILTAARSDAAAGLVNLPGGLTDYRTLIEYHTSLPPIECDAQAIHDFGLAEVARIRAEISVLGGREFGQTDVASIQKFLRDSPEMHFQTREQVESKAVEALFAARARMSQYFGRIPRAACEVVRIPSYEEKDTTIAYYREPSADGTRPGRYFINTYRPETRPRYEAEVLAYHEAIPGHHLQLAIAQELTDVPLFRRHSGSTAFVEGWALYTERLCDEMDLYTGDLDRLGVLSFDAWRACRLVVDTGMHAFGWTRQQAIDYLYENTLLARNNVENEVDRYIAWPGQALAYKIGQREFLTLRDEAQAILGPAFSYPEFHDRVLENGAVPLTSLRRVVSRWLAN